MSSTEIDVVKLAEVSFVTDLNDLTALQGTAPGNSFRLARLQFKADTVGVASFDFRFDDLTDLNGRPVLADLSGTSVTIAGPQEPPPAETPEPATMMLGGVGLAVALGMRRFRGK